MPNPRVCLLLLIAADAAFISADLASRQVPALGDLFRLSREHGPAELFQYAKMLWIAGMLALLWSRTQVQVYAAWALLFAYALCDDALQLHERGGRLLASGHGPELVFGVEAKDLGELAVWGFFGAVFFGLIVLAYLRSGPEGRRASHRLALLFAVLLFFGLALDMLHTATDPYQTESVIKRVVGILEDGGEMVTMSLIVWYVLRLLRYSTVTDLARLRGLSTSLPRSKAA